VTKTSVNLLDGIPVLVSEFFAQPLLSSFLPLRFSPDTKQTWNSIEAYCSRCKDHIEDENVRGTVLVRREGGVAYRSQGPIHAFRIEAGGYCTKCNLISPLLYDLNEDMTMSGPSPHTGEWVTWEANRTPWRIKAWKRIKKVLGLS
jgi:hypothetical protein